MEEKSPVTKEEIFLSPNTSSDININQDVNGDSTKNISIIECNVEEVELNKLKEDSLFGNILQSEIVKCSINDHKFL